MKTISLTTLLALALLSLAVGCDSPDGTVAACTNGTLQLCTTFCNTQGTATCANGQFGQCIPPQEVANGQDDNCNGQ
ncbi:MAG: hypothetical protein VX938_10195, partial [Myxococcota bacterium]|nr:hypothetical protein [Myxococcota bacterium]